MRNTGAETDSMRARNHDRRGRPTREPLDAVVALIAGIFLGATFFFGASVWAKPKWFSWPAAFGAMGLGAVACGVLGCWKGDDFFRWVRDHLFQ